MNNTLKNGSDEITEVKEDNNTITGVLVALIIYSIFSIIINTVFIRYTFYDSLILIGISVFAIIASVSMIVFPKVKKSIKKGSKHNAKTCNQSML